MQRTGVLKLRRSIVILGAGSALLLLVMGMLLAGNDYWQGGNAGRFSPVYAGLFAIGILGIIGMGLSYRMLIRAMSSIASELSREQGFEVSGLSGIDKLTEAVHASSAHYRGLTQSLQAQVKAYQIRTQLAEKQAHHTEGIIDSLRDAVIVIDESDKVVLANQAAVRLLGFEYSHCQTPLLTDILGHTMPDLIGFVCQSRMSNVQAARRRIETPVGDRALIYDCIASCVRDERDEVYSVVLVLHDITREQQLSQVKSDFISHVSHELKTPLASIAAYAEMLIDGEADNEQMCKDFYAIIQGQAKRLNRLIEDILNISRIESGLLTIHREHVSLAVLLEEQLQLIRSYAEERNIKVVEHKPVIHDQVYADRDMMAQVIVNLLSNAIKYNQPGGSVSVQTQVDDGLSVVRVNVIDTGLGISAQEIDQVFRKFYRVSTNEDRVEGTGLGLSLVKQIIEDMHGGKVYVKSEVGVGSTFGFELPLAQREDVKETYTPICV